MRHRRPSRGEVNSLTTREWAHVLHLLQGKKPGSSRGPWLIILLGTEGLYMSPRFFLLLSTPMIIPFLKMFLFSSFWYRRWRFFLMIDGLEGTRGSCVVTQAIFFFFFFLAPWRTAFLSLLAPFCRSANATSYFQPDTARCLAYLLWSLIECCSKF